MMTDSKWLSFNSLTHQRCESLTLLNWQCFSPIDEVEWCWPSLMGEESENVHARLWPARSVKSAFFVSKIASVSERE